MTHLQFCLWGCRHIQARLIIVKIFRLYQPRNPLFWIMVALNALPALLGWITLSYALDVAASLLVAGFAIGNALPGSRLTWRLVHS